MAQTIGEQLKQARVKRGLTIEQASQATHIRPHYLEALENNQRDALPSPVQGRGFLRLYADFLNLPTAPILAGWEGKALPASPEPQSPSATATISPQPAQPQIEPASSAVPEPVRPAAEPTPQAPSPVPVYPTGATTPNGASQAIFKEIGDTLKNQRETLGLSLAEVERYTRLRQHYVQAMEEGRVDHLPSPVQGRGMLSNYAAFLNLDEDKLMLRFAEGLMARRVENMPAPEPQSIFSNKKRPARQAPFWRRFLTPDLMFGVVVAVIILVFSVWTAARISSLRATQKEPTPPGVAEVLLTPRANTDLTTTPGASTTNVSTQVSGAANEDLSAQTAVPQGPALVGQTVTPGSGTQSAALQTANGTPLPAGVTATVAPLNKDPLQIYIIAKQRAWMRIITDDKIKFQGRTVPGNAYAFSATKRLELLTGDASAIQVYYNQKDLGTLGTEAQVVSLVFVPEGMYTPTAAFTPTYTPTTRATPTSLPTQTPLASPTITPYIPTK